MISYSIGLLELEVNYWTVYFLHENDWWSWSYIIVTILTLRFTAVCVLNIVYNDDAGSEVVHCGFWDLKGWIFLGCPMCQVEAL